MQNRSHQPDYEADRSSLLAADSGGGGARNRRPRGPASSGKSLTTAQEARQINDSLLRTKRMMSQELDRVSAVHGTLEEGADVIHATTEEHMDMGGVVKGARGALRTLGRQDVREAVVLRCSVVFFYAAALYVLWTRIKIPFLLW